MEFFVGTLLGRHVVKSSKYCATLSQGGGSGNITNLCQPKVDYLSDFAFTFMSRWGDDNVVGFQITMQQTLSMCDCYSRTNVMHQSHCVFGRHSSSAFQQLTQ